MTKQGSLFPNLEPREPKPTLVDEILAVLVRWAVPQCAVHYLGCADVSLIRALQAKHYRVSVMAMRGCAPEGVDAHVEGAPPHQVLLQDTPLDEHQRELLANKARPTNKGIMTGSVSGGRQRATLGNSPRRPDMIVLWGEAKASELPQTYHWRAVGSLMVGKL